MVQSVVVSSTTQPRLRQVVVLLGVVVVQQIRRRQPFRRCDHRRIYANALRFQKFQIPLSVTTDLVECPTVRSTCAAFFENERQSLQFPLVEHISATTKQRLC